MKSVTLKVGESVTTSGFLSVATSGIVYGGMVSDRVFSLSVRSISGRGGFDSYTLYFPVGTTEHQVGKKKLYIRSVTPSEIIVELE